MHRRRPYEGMLRPIARRVILSVLACTAISVKAQDNVPALHQIQAVVIGVNSPQHAHQADLILRAQPGVIMSRTDHNTRNILLHIAPNITLDQARLNELLAPLGMSVRCVERTLLGSTRFKHLDPQTCGSDQPQDR